METYSENTVAIIRGDCCVRSSGIKLEEFVLQPAIEKVYEDVTEETEQLKEDVDESLIENTKSLTDYINLLSLTLPIASLPQCSTTRIVDNPEWQYVITDSEDKILCGVNTEGKSVFYVTTEELMDCINASFDPNYLDLYQMAINMAMAKLPSTVTQNPEWSFVICDAEDKILMGIKTDKTYVCYVTQEKLWDYVVESLE